jgi:hypothetical protein
VRADLFSALGGFDAGIDYLGEDLDLCWRAHLAGARVLICAANPDSAGVRTAGGDWSCDGFTPVVTPAQLNAGDHRGFDKSAWTKLSAPREASG